MQTFVIKSDVQILKDVIHELEYDPSLHADQIDVSVKKGLVTLNGSVPQYGEKYCAEKATQRVRGVRAISDQLTVNSAGTLSDESIAKTALSLLDWNYQVPDGVVPIVENGWITLRGIAEFEFEKTAASNAVKDIKGIHGVINYISVKEKISALDIKADIEAALIRSAKSEAEQINVAVAGGVVNLWGPVASMSRMREAREAAWSAPGVSKVTDFLTLAE